MWMVFVTRVWGVGEHAYMLWTHVAVEWTDVTSISGMHHHA